jgi:hypothetical protein
MDMRNRSGGGEEEGKAHFRGGGKLKNGWGESIANQMIPSSSILPPPLLLLICPVSTNPIELVAPNCTLGRRGGKQPKTYALDWREGI